MREQKKEQTFLQDLANIPVQNNADKTIFNEKITYECKTKRLRMQNSKGTSGMFIKP